MDPLPLFPEWATIRSKRPVSATASGTILAKASRKCQQRAWCALVARITPPFATRADLLPRAGSGGQGPTWATNRQLGFLPWEFISDGRDRAYQPWKCTRARYVSAPSCLKQLRPNVAPGYRPNLFRSASETWSRAPSRAFLSIPSFCRTIARKSFTHGPSINAVTRPPLNSDPAGVSSMPPKSSNTSWPPTSRLSVAVQPISVSRSSLLKVNSLLFTVSWEA